MGEQDKQENPESGPENPVDTGALMERPGEPVKAEVPAKPGERQEQALKEAEDGPTNDDGELVNEAGERVDARGRVLQPWEVSPGRKDVSGREA